MPDAQASAAILLVAGPLIGVLGFYDRALYTIWTAPRAEFLAIIARHRRGWIALNFGFGVATLTTTVGLALVVASIRVEATVQAWLALAVGAYAFGGGMWFAVLAIRTRTAPLLATMAATGRSAEPADAILDAASGALFAAYVLLTGLALTGLGVGLVIGGVVAPVGALVALSGVACVVWLVRTGDIIPAVLYVPTTVLGVALLLG